MSKKVRKERPVWLVALIYLGELLGVLAGLLVYIGTVFYLEQADHEGIAVLVTVVPFLAFMYFVIYMVIKDERSWK